MRVAVVGSNGQLGVDVMRVYGNAGHAVIGLTHADIEVSDLSSVLGCLGSAAPQLVINTAAVHNVDRCEADPALARAVNVTGAYNVAAVCAGLGAAVVHISTDYVFDGNRQTPYSEQDEARPINVYGLTKLEGERGVTAVNNRAFVVRTSGLYGKSPCRAKGGQNFVQLMLRLGRERGAVRVVQEEFVSPTSTRELAEQIAVLTATDAYGVYHATAEGFCSWFEFAKAIFDIAGVAATVSPAGAEEFPYKTPRPKYSVLENRNLKRQGLDRLRPWREGLRSYLEEAWAAAC